jgi:hypothetical protein
MKKLSYVLLIVLALSAMLISACGASAPVSSTGGGDKPQPSPVDFTGVIESINGNEWSINGQTITVDPAVVRDGPFKVGDTVKVEVKVQTDGSMVVTRVEIPGVNDNTNDVNSNDVNSNDINSNDVNSNDVNSNDVNSNDVNSNDVNSNDDNSNINTNDSNSNDDNSNVNTNDSNSNDDSSNVNSNDSNSNDSSSNDSNSNNTSSDDSSSHDNGNSNDD